MVTGFTSSGWGKLLDLLYVQLNRTSFFPLDYLPFCPRLGSTFIALLLVGLPALRSAHLRLVIRCCPQDQERAEEEIVRILHHFFPDRLIPVMIIQFNSSQTYIPPFPYDMELQYYNTTLNLNTLEDLQIEWWTL